MEYCGLESECVVGSSDAFVPDADELLAVASLSVAISAPSNSNLQVSRLQFGVVRFTDRNLSTLGDLDGLLWLVTRQLLDLLNLGHNLHA